MGANPHWFDQIRARGLCYICRRPMADDDPRRYHTECGIEAGRGRRRRYADIRRVPPPLRPWRLSQQPFDVKAAPAGKD